jgi:hypothetical protein
MTLIAWVSHESCQSDPDRIIYTIRVALIYVAFAASQFLEIARELKK